MKIAVTGHTSGIGRAVHDMCDLTLEGQNTVRGYSKSNGWNLAEDNGDKLIQELVDFDPDVLINNAWYPGIIRNSFRDGTDHQIKMFNISFSFVNSPLLTRVSIAGNTDPEKMIDVMDAAEIILDCMDDNDKTYDIVEQVIQCRALTSEELVANFMTGARNMAKHIIRSDRAIKKSTNSST